MARADFDRIIEKYRTTSFSERDKGTRFERLMKGFLLTYELYSNKFQNVWMWEEFPFRADFGGKDIGIDLVAKTFTGEYWSVQCKCYAENATVDKGEVDSFLSASNMEFLDENGKTARFAQLLWISTTNHWGSTANNVLKNYEKQFTRLNLTCLREANVDWNALDEGIFGSLAKEKISREPRPHQKDAIKSAHEYFKTNERGKLIMACGTGKTYTSLKIAEQETNDNGFVLFLVPSIALLSQTLFEWSKFTEKNIEAICICSDAAASKKADNEDMSVIDLALPATTDIETITNRIKYARFADKSKENALTVVFSTYQSAEVVSKAQKKLLSEANAEEKASYMFDLIICDEAHRTTGFTLKGNKQSSFVSIHDNNFLKANHRLYMTATPRLYTDESKKKAAQKEAVLCSMDDKNLYGEEIYRIGFGEAVEKHLLSDYKVIVLTISDNQIPPVLQEMIAKPDSEINTDDAAKLIGCINALSKRMIEQSKLLAEVDPAPMHTAMAFCSSIKNSKKITQTFNEGKDAYYNSLSESVRQKTVLIESDHVDGSMGAAERDRKLNWLKDTPRDGRECRILTNVRCLSEGVDVPSLDAVLFLSARESQVDVVQSVGRVMRVAEGKKYGYIIIPVIIPVTKDPKDALDDNKRFSVVWSVLNALRAHDDRFNATVNKIDFNKKDTTGRIIVGGVGSTDDDGDTSGETEPPIQTTLYFDELTGAIYARMVDKVGNKHYWEDWAEDIAKIAARHKARIEELIKTDPKHRKAFDNFIKGLHISINPYITDEDAMDMLAQHLITQPVFEALFENYSFAKNNAVSESMQNMLKLLDEDGMKKDREVLDKFYKSVQMRCSDIKNAEDRQKIIIELYDKFFKTALPKTVGKLGIVYTPVEVVDFILHSVNDVIYKEFNCALSDENVHILDPFTGTGTFITRLLQSGLIKPEDLERKYKKELHANEIVLLAYYIASINIENAYHDLAKSEKYIPFEGICLTDTFQLGENEDTALFAEFFPKNSERVERQKNTPIRVIIGNPPYSVGQRSANDNAKNESYEKLENRIKETYVAGTNATNKNALYDSYIKAFRWASDRIEENNEGVIGFVSNAGWLDGNAMDGMRKCFEKEFSSIYVFNLRGNARTSGEIRRKEKDNVFGQGSRTPVTITLLVKNPNAKNKKANIYYRDIGDYLTREEKLSIIKKIGSCLSDKFAPITLKPDEKGDWINQRNSVFENLIPIEPDKKFNRDTKSVFVVNSRGLETGRDIWIYNFSRNAEEKNIQSMIKTYNEQRIIYNESQTKEKVQDFVIMDKTKISWTDSLLSSLRRNLTIDYDLEKLMIASYRPFQYQFVYKGNGVIHRQGQFDDFFPTSKHDNLLICVSGIGVTKGFSVIITNKIMDLEFVGKTQCFPLYYYEEKEIAQKSLFNDDTEKYARRDGVTDFIYKQARDIYGASVTKEDIFFYVYGFLHIPKYRETFAADLKKSLPRLMLVNEPKIFWQISKIGRELAKIHLNYENQETPEDVIVDGEDFKDFKVQKLRFISKEDKSTLIYNDKIRIKNIPLKAYEYTVNGRSPIEWVMDRYQVKVDNDSGIENDPNKWAEEHQKPRYILDLILSLITVSLKTLELVEKLPEVKFE